MIPQPLTVQAASELLYVTAIRTAQEEGGLKVGRSVGHPSIEEPAELVALCDGEATLRWSSGHTERFPAAEVYDVDRAMVIAIGLARACVASAPCPPPAPPVEPRRTVKVNAAPLQRQLWGLVPLRRPSGGRD